MTPDFHEKPFRRALLVASALLCAAGLVQAQSHVPYPSKPIRFVVPFAAGGALDYVARVLGAEITRQSRAQVIVDNRPGASGILAAENVRGSAPDGYSVLITNMESHVNNLGLFKSLPYDPVRDFQPVGLIASAAAILVGNAAMPPSSLAQFVAYARADKGGVSFGTWGNGTYSHIAIATLGRIDRFAVVTVPYKGESPVVQDLLGGNLSFAMASVLVAKAQTDKGAMKAYAVNGDRRLALMPTVPTFKELGYTDPVLNMRPWFAAYAPAGTPKAVVERINTLLRDALRDPSVASSLSDKGFEPIGSSPAEHQRELARQIQTFTKVMHDIGIRPE